MAGVEAIPSEQSAHPTPEHGEILVACDGSVRQAAPIGAAGGWAWVSDTEHWQAGGAIGEDGRRSGLMELLAIARFLEATQGHSQTRFLVLSDSHFALYHLGVTAADGKRIRRTLRYGRERELRDEIAQALSARPGVRLAWVKGHSTHYLNRRADALAGAQATLAGNRWLAEAGPGWPDGAPA